MDSLAALNHRLEYLFLKKVIASLRSETLSVGQAKKAAQDFLKMQPFASEEETYIKIMDYTTQHTDFPELKEYMHAYQKEKGELAKIEQMKAFLKQKDIEGALSIAKQE